jgi:hypothetical protein
MLLVALQLPSIRDVGRRIAVDDMLDRDDLGATVDQALQIF